MASEYDSLLITLLAIAGFGGVTMNTCFLLLNLSQKEFRKGYFIFLQAASFLNLVHSWVIMVLQPLIIARDISGDSSFCKLLSYIHIVSGVGGISIQSLLSFNRYIALFHSAKLEYFFTSWKIVTMLTITILIPAVCGILLWYFNDLGRPLDMICEPKINEMPMARILLVFGPMMTSYAISTIFTFKIFRLIKRHSTAESNVVSRIQEASEIVRLISIEIVLPVCMETPAVVLSFMTNVVDIPLPIYNVALFFFVLHSTTDPVVAMIVVKPYRKTIKRLCNKFRKIPDESSTVFQMSSKAPSSKNRFLKNSLNEWRISACLKLNLCN